MFSRLTPKQKQMVAVGGAIGAALLVVTIAMSSQDTATSSRNADDDIRYILTDRDTRDVTMGSLSTQLSAAQQSNSELREEFERLQKQVADETQSGVPNSVLRELDSLSRQIDLLREENRELKERTESIDLSAVGLVQNEGSDKFAPENLPTVVEEDAPSAEQDIDNASSGDTLPDNTDTADNSLPDFGSNDSPLTKSSVFSERPVQRRFNPDMQAQQGGNDSEEQDGEQPPSLSITTYYQENHPDDQIEEEQAKAAYLPSGSILSGVLLNGLDAPTGQGARRDPFPVTIRIKHDAILPNRFSANVKECFLLLSGHGELSTERAYLRGNNVSCMTDEGDVIETELRGYAVGEDGKAGLRGRLVSKQGAVIARSIVAGFFSGVAGAFDVDPIQVITPQSINGRQEYQSNFSSDIVQGASAQGAGQALDRVSEFYLEMADKIFPVVEIDSGRSVDVILTEGLSMKPAQFE